MQFVYLKVLQDSLVPRHLSPPHQVCIPNLKASHTHHYDIFEPLSDHLQCALSRFVCLPCCGSHQTGTISQSEARLVC